MKYSSVSIALVMALSVRAGSAFLVGPRMAPMASSRLFLFDKLFSSTKSNTDSKYPIYAQESVMSQKAHGTSEKPVQKNLLWKCDYDTADRSKWPIICC